MERKWAEELVLGRSVRIGSLQYYRDVERHSPGKGDENENSTALKPSTDVFTYHSDRGIGQQLARHGLSIDNIAFDNGSTHIRIQGQNAYVFCMSKTNSRSVAQNIDNGYDSCVLVGSPSKFAQALTNALRKNGIAVKEPTCGHITYRSRTIDENGTIENSPFLKDLKFEVDQEFRFVWFAQTYETFVDLKDFDIRGCNLLLL